MRLPTAARYVLALVLACASIGLLTSGLPIASRESRSTYVAIAIIELVVAVLLSTRATARLGATLTMSGALGAGIVTSAMIASDPSLSAVRCNCLGPTTGTTFGGALLLQGGVLLLAVISLGPAGREPRED